MLHDVSDGGRGGASSRGARNASLYLAELLTRAYRSTWDKLEYVERISRKDLHYGAIAHVLADHLAFNPREGRPQDREIEPPQLVPLVSRALRGERLSRQTLQLFIDAFDIDATHEATLWALWNEEEGTSVILGNLSPPEEIPGYQALAYDVLKLQEHHWLGPDGLPVRHRTEITIRSRVEGLASYQHRMDTPNVRVRTRRGGQQGELYEAGNGIWAVDLTFPQPLRRREVHYIEFWTLLKYDTPPPREMRRGTRERIEHLDIRVEFDRERLPRSVWWAEWADYQGPDNRIIAREPCELDHERAVHRYLELIERAVVGFCWDW